MSARAYDHDFVKSQIAWTPTVVRYTSYTTVIWELEASSEKSLKTDLSARRYIGGSFKPVVPHYSTEQQVCANKGPEEEDRKPVIM